MMYPFVQVEHVLDNKFMKACTLHWQKIYRATAATAKRFCFATYESKKKKLKSLFNWVHKVNITINMSTSCQKVSYMVVTCILLDFEWNLNMCVLNICNISRPLS